MRALKRLLLWLPTRFSIESTHLCFENEWVQLNLGFKQEKTGSDVHHQTWCCFLVRKQGLTVIFFQREGGVVFNLLLCLTVSSLIQRGSVFEVIVPPRRCPR
jgi:hypothetical protein